MIGIGGGSQVFRGTTSDGRLVAVKLLNQGRPQAQEELLTDIEINSSLKHRHIVPLLGYSVDAKHLILVYEFLPNGNLDDHLHGTTFYFYPNLSVFKLEFLYYKFMVYKLCFVLFCLFFRCICV